MSESYFDDMSLCAHEWESITDFIPMAPGYECRECKKCGMRKQSPGPSVCLGITPPTDRSGRE